MSKQLPVSLALILVFNSSAKQGIVFLYLSFNAQFWAPKTLNHLDYDYSVNGLSDNPYKYGTIEILWSIPSILRDVIPRLLPVIDRVVL